MPPVIKVSNLSKQYRLGQVGTGTISHDVNRWWHKVRGKEDPYLKIGESNDRTVKGESDYVWALKDINFEVEQGEVLGIIGRNGAGKSTLLKILSRTTSPTTGSVKLKGRVASLLEVGTGFHPELSGRDNIYLNGAILGMTRQEIKRKFDEIVDFAGVERYIDTPVKRYSSGMYVRLAFGVAAHLESEILIVDEVLAVGDAEFQKKCLGKMKEVSEGQGRTVLFVSHNMAAISNLCNRSIFLRNGQKYSEGVTDKILKEYISYGRQSKAELTNEDEIFTSSNSDFVGFNAIRIKSEDQITNSINISRDVVIEVEFEVLINGIEIYPSFHLLDDMDTCIFASFNGTSATANSDNFFGKKLCKGIYKSSMIIPGNFLNEKTYRINAFLIPNNDMSSIVAVYDILEFKITDNGGMRKEYAGDWIGLIRPKLNWQTQKIV
jgi:lipopolysaccharide transport system ATP-binding protein